MKRIFLSIIAIVASQILVAQVYRDAGLGFHDGLSLVKGYTSTNGYSLKYGYVNKSNKLVIPLKYEDANSFNEGMANVRIGQLWGYINTSGKEVVPLKYDFALEFKNGFGIVGIADKGRGCVNKNGKLIVPCIYDAIYYFYDKKNQCDSKSRVVCAKLKEECFVFNETGKNILPAGYDFNEQFTYFIGKDNIMYFVVVKDNKCGLLNERGEIVISASYDQIEPYDDTRFSVSDNGKSGLLDLSGNIIIPTKYDKISDWGYCYKVTLDNKSGVIDTIGKVLIPVEFDKIESDLLHYKVYKENMFGYYDLNGKVLMPAEYIMVGKGADRNQIIVKHNGKYGVQFQSSPDEKVTDCIFDDLYVCKNDYVAKKNGKFGIIDAKGTQRIDFVFDGISTTQDGIIVTKNGLRGFYRYWETSYTEILPCQYQDIVTIKDDDWPYTNSLAVATKGKGKDHFFVKQNGKWGVMNNKGEVVVDCISNMIPLIVTSGCESERGFVCDKSGKLGMISTFKNEIIPFKYEVFEPSEGMIRVKKEDLFGYVKGNYDSKTGKGLRDIMKSAQTQSFQYEDAKDYHEGLAAIKTKGKFGYIDNSGNIVIKCKYDEASDFIGGKALVKKGSKEFYIDKEGEKLK